MIQQQKMVHVVLLVLASVDIVAGDPQNNVEEKHSTSDYAQQPVEFFVVAIAGNMVLIKTPVNLQANESTLSRAILVYYL